MAETNSKQEQSFEVEVASASHLTQAEFRAKMKAALEEATKRFEAQHKVAIEIQGNADGGLFGLGAAWPWVIHIAGKVLGHLVYDAAGEAAKEMGKEGGQSFYEMLKEALRKRNLTTSAPHDLRLFPDPDHPYASFPPAAPPSAGKKQKRKRKTATTSRKKRTKTKRKGR